MGMSSMLVVLATLKIDVTTRIVFEGTWDVLILLNRKRNSIDNWKLGHRGYQSVYKILKLSLFQKEAD